MSSSQVIKSSPGDKVHRMSNDNVKDNDGNALPNTQGNIVDFKVEYSKEFKGAKFLKDGDTHKLHVVHAEHLEKIGAGKIKK